MGTEQRSPQKKGNAMKTTIGIDPGKSGAVAVIQDNGEAYATTFVDDSIGSTVSEILTLHKDENVCVYLEKVHAFPGQGVSSSFAFGRAFGEVIGALDAIQAPYRLVTPQAWQKPILWLPKKKDGATAHKRALKTEAQRKFPSCKPTLKTCDALLIADWGSRDRI